MQVLRQVHGHNPTVELCIRNIKGRWCVVTEDAWNASWKSVSLCILVCAELHNTRATHHVLIEIQPDVGICWNLRSS